jgi:hypothetical protein
MLRVRKERAMADNDPPSKPMSGAAVEGQAHRRIPVGELGISAEGKIEIRNLAPGWTLIEPTDEDRFNLLRSRVNALETVRRALDDVTPGGVGHNRGPSDFEPASADELAEIDRLISLLNEQTPDAVINQEQLTEAQQKTSIIAEKIREYLDVFMKKLAESAGTEVGKILPKIPLWYGLYATLNLVSEAAVAWLHHLPH